MAVETVYADGGGTGITNPSNAYGSNEGTWAGPALNANNSETGRFTLADPDNPLTATATQTITVLARKGGNSGNPTITLTLYDGATSLGTLDAAQSITSTAGATFTRTFTVDPSISGAGLEVEVAISGAGGGPTARNSAQIAYIKADLDTITPIPFGGSFWRIASGGKARVRMHDGLAASVRLADGRRL